MRKSIWYNNNIHFFVEYKPSKIKNKIIETKENSLFTMNKYFFFSNENNNIYFYLYKKLEFYYIYFLYYIFLSKHIQNSYLFNKNIIYSLFNNAFITHFFRFL